MINWTDLAERFLEAFGGVVSLDGGLHWISLSSALAIALLVYVLRRNRTESSGLRGFVAFCFPSRVYSSASSRLDFKYLLINTLIFGGLIAPVVLTSAGSAQATLSLLIKTWGIPEAPLQQSIVTDLGVTVGIVMAADVGFFVSHYLQHRIPFLWEFHKVHHSAEVLHPVTAYRSHPVDEVIKTTFVAGATGVVLGLSAYFVGQPVDGITVLGVNLFVLIFSIAGSHLRHSHVWLSYGWLDQVFVSPAMHQIHHSCAPRHFDKNLGGFFTIWDRLAGTLYLPSKSECFPLGLEREEHQEYTSVLRLYLLPFAKVAKRVGAAAQIRRLKLRRFRALRHHFTHWINLCICFVLAIPCLGMVPLEFAGAGSSQRRQQSHPRSKPKICLDRLELRPPTPIKKHLPLTTLKKPGT
jgi:sterol desaturase/sphingolipid hydroxylase (fatty acid hydroxylase superfamily)